MNVVQHFDPSIEMPDVESPVPEGKAPAEHLKDEVRESIAWTRSTCPVAEVTEAEPDAMTRTVTYRFADWTMQTDTFRIEA